MEVDLSNYVCTVPFEAMEIHENSNFMCCASWLLKPLPNNVPIKDLWNSQEAQDIRKSVTDGSFRHCDKNQCPYLSQLVKFGGGSIGPIKHINDLPVDIDDYVKNNTVNIEGGPKIIQMSFDRTCNFKCPSCRVDMIVADSDKIKTVNLTIEEIEEAYSDSIEMIYCSGTADPFASVSYRNFLRNFNPEKYPKLKHIHLHTNASLWDEKMWNSMPNIHKYVKTCEISIDAGTKDTYENITRLGGNWDKLMDNLKFISTIDTLKSVKCSFVVQTSNYSEMVIFTKTMKKILGKKGHIFFGKINNWGTFNNEQFMIHKIWDPQHPEHKLFVDMVNVATKPLSVFHNLQEFIDTSKKTLI